MKNKIKVINYWKDEAHKEVKKKEALSNILAFTKNKKDLDFTKIEKNLKKLDMVKDIKKEGEKIVVTVEFKEITTKVDLLVGKNHKLIGEDISSTIKITGANQGVRPDVIKSAFANPNVLVSIAKFDIKNPLSSYYVQNKVLSTAVDAEFLYDMSSKKIFPKEYIEYLDKVSLESLVNNVYTSLLTKDGWMTTVGLSRFHIKDIEINNVSNQALILNLFKTINTNRLLKGEIVQDQIIDYGAGKYFMVLDVEKAIEILPDKYLDVKKYSKGHLTNKNRQILIPLKNKEVDLLKLENSIDISEFEKVGINFETPEFLINRVKAARETLPFLFEYLQENNKFVFMVEFELSTGDKREYIYATVTSFRGENFEALLVRDSMHDKNLKKDSKVTINLNKISNWEARLSKTITVNSTNPYIFKIIKKIDKLDK